MDNGVPIWWKDPVLALYLATSRVTCWYVRSLRLLLVISRGSNVLLLKELYFNVRIMIYEHGSFMEVDVWINQENKAEEGSLALSGFPVLYTT